MERTEQGPAQLAFPVGYCISGECKCVVPYLRVLQGNSIGIQLQQPSVSWVTRREEAYNVHVRKVGIANTNYYNGKWQLIVAHYLFNGGVHILCNWMLALRTEL